MDEVEFRGKVDEALKSVRKILDNTRHPELATAVQHEYDDKYILAEFVVNSTLASLLNVLDALGLSDEHARQLKAWSATRAVSLALDTSFTCVFDREETRKEESKTQHEREHKGTFGSFKVTDKVVTTIHEYYWKVHTKYALFAYAGTETNERVVLRERTAACEVMTSSDANPYKKEQILPRVQVDLTWLLQQLGDDLTLRFAIDRSAKSCHTPRRNADVGGALEFFDRVRTEFADKVTRTFHHTLFPIQQKHGLDTNKMTAAGVFVPILPLFEKRADGAEDRPGLSIADLNSFLAHQRVTMEEKFAALAKMFPDDGKLITHVDAQLVVMAQHMREVVRSGAGGVAFIEGMLRDQLIAAIGKVVTAVDFSEYMAFHNRKLYRSEFEPSPFCHAVRRPDHYPEGILSIEQMKADGSIAEPVVTVVRHSLAAAAMKFPLDASTSVKFYGDRFVHGWIGHKFSNNTGSSVKLVARARQFSSYIVLVGRMGGPGLFEPKHAMIIQNKDELTIPIDLETIPTPKEFADAIESLSPEQQRFAKAIRSMQLEGTVFGVAVVQIKPQLERLLNLPDDALTKEIRLTTDLLDLFMKYQIPSDLLSFDGDEATGATARVEAVRGYVAAMVAMIQEKKDAEMAAELARKEYAEAQLRLQRERERQQKEMEEEVKRCDMRKKVKRKAAPRMQMAKMSRARVSAAPMMACSMAAPSSAPPPRQSSAPPPAQSSAPTPAPAPAPTAPVTEAVAVEAPAGEAAAEAADKTPSVAGADVAGEGEDYTQLPVQLDAMLAELDEDNAVRPTIINTAKAWTHTFKKTLLSDEETRTLAGDGQKSEKDRAFDLLDALTRSGALPVEQASLHVVIAATHCFDKSLVETVVQDNVNPIEKVERTSLIMSSVVHGCAARDLIKPSQLARVKQYSPMLFKDDNE
eukprot:TRINITY_DN1724_c0_g1_i1.p1 TRINITY_DN1724_c0_g1~~TRINITY_DN1724_c0_g1_i1.p1  ORF type:complete len:931 (+),score=378.48 TRINITY_DN1724_c0_g1_i1:35-2794(+)